MVLLIGNNGPEKTAEDSIRALELEIEIYEEQKKREFAPGILSELDEKIKSTEAEIRLLKTADNLPKGNILMNGLKNNIDELGIRMNQTPDIKKRDALKQQQLECLAALAAREKTIENLDELSDAVDQIESDERLAQRWYSRDFDAVDLELLLSSDMIAFFDTKERQALEKAFGQMVVNDNTQSVLKKNDTLYGEVEMKWQENVKEIKGNIRDFQIEEAELQLRLSQAKADKKQAIRSRLIEVKSILRNLTEEIENGRSAWMHETRTRIEKESSPKVLSIVSPETMNMLFSHIKEAQYIRMEKVQDFLTKELEDLEGLYKKHNDAGHFSEETQKEYEAELAHAKRVILEERQYDPKTIRTLAKNFSAAKMTLGDSAEEVRQTAENREKIEKQIQTQYKRLQRFRKELSPELKQKMLTFSKNKIARLSEYGFSENKGLGKKELDAIQSLNEPNDELTKMLKKVEELMADLPNLSNEELAAFHQDLQTFTRVLDTTDAELAHKTIEELEWLNDSREIRRTLEENLGPEHLRIIPHTEFEASHKDVTEGDMILDETEPWTIIIDEAVFEKNPEAIKKQLIHELLHVEFEKHPSIKDELREKLSGGDPEQWQKIRNAFVAKERANGTKAPDGREWQTDGSHDDHILSEIYAMQNELPTAFSAGNSANDKFKNLLVGSSLASALGDIKDKTKKYENEADPKIRRGYHGLDDEDEESFQDVTTMTKEEASYQENDQEIQNLRDRIEELKKSGYLGMVPGAESLISAMSDYNEGTDSLNQELRSDPKAFAIASAVKNRIEMLKGDLGEVSDKVGKQARNAPNTEIGFLRKLWLNTNFVSTEDFVQMGKDAYEFFQRRHKRKVSDHAAKLGMALFSGTDLGREANARSQKAEAEEVNEWKSRYENLDAWQLLDELKGISKSINPNQDQLKAILRILSEKGRLNWQNTDLWTALNKLQSAVMLKPGDPLLLHNQVLLRQRLHHALGEIYDYDEFPELERKNEGAYQSEKGKYETLNDRMQDQLNQRLDELLAQHRAGEQVDPMLYESILEYSIKKGKCFAENVMFHFICGMAEGLLAPDRGLAMGDHINNWPAQDWFSTISNPPMSTEDWKRYAKQHFGHSFKKGSITSEGGGEDFINWYWTTVQNDQRVVDRVKKSVGERAWDHDWGRSIAPLGDARTAKKFLSGRSGQEETKSTAVANAYVGAVQWLEENAKNPQAANRATFARMAGWIAMSEGMLDGTAYKEKSKDINTRADEAMNQDVPREAGVGRHGGETVKQHRDRCKNFLRMIDPQFFDLITGRDAREDKVKKELGEAAKNYLVQRYPSLTEGLAQVETIDQIYDNIDLIIGTMFEALSPSQFQGILSEMARAK